jgi:pyruvyltransferase
MCTDNPEKIIALHYTENFGDDLTPYLLKRLFNITVTSRTKENEHLPHYLVVGSILGDANSQSTVCGSGFIMAEQALYPIQRPASIISVRGPLTRQILHGYGLSCPESYGDWGLLLRFLPIVVPKKRYNLGIIPHYVDAQVPIVHELGKRDNVLVIDITSGVDSVISQILQCRCCISSSLHGLIACDAWGIPNAWAILSNNVVGSGFKFYDYFQSCGREGAVPIYPLPFESIDRLCGQVEQNYKFEFDFDTLVATLPFQPTFPR